MSNELYEKYQAAFESKYLIAMKRGSTEQQRRAYDSVSDHFRRVVKSTGRQYHFWDRMAELRFGKKAN